MNDRDRLINLLVEKSIDTNLDVEQVADHLIANGVIVLVCEDEKEHKCKYCNCKAAKYEKVFSTCREKLKRWRKIKQILNNIVELEKAGAENE